MATVTQKLQMWRPFCGKGQELKSRGRRWLGATRPSKIGGNTVTKRFGPLVIGTAILAGSAFGAAAQEMMAEGLYLGARAATIMSLCSTRI